MNEHEASQAQRGLLNAYRTERYYTRVAECSRVWKIAFSLAVTIGPLAAAFFAGADIVTNNNTVFSYVAVLLGLASGIISIIAVVFDHSSRSVRASNLAKECSLLAADWRSLFIVTYPDASRRIVEYSKKQKELEAPVSSEIPFRPKVNKAAGKVAYKLILAELHGEENGPTKTEQGAATAAEAST